ncbi:MAG TPA: DNA primase [Candidatus Limnocylindrales bacterium]|nr:DNA primase [Candidatus Limnocylindrales bacterium]
MAGFLSPATREQIRAASDIVDVIGSYLPLKRAGANFTALCPFHKEKSPSFNVNPHKQIFHCFGCHKGGDVFTFVKDYENIGFMDAVRRLAERAKIPLEFENSPGEQQSRHLKDQLLQIHDQITQRWQNCLANEAAGQLARDYLQKRGVSADAIKLFRIGAAPELWDDTVNWAKSKNLELDLVEKAGLIIRKEETGNYYDRFRGRLMFPICDEQGRVVGFSGRVLSGDEKTAKYLNSPETAIFTKSKIFFGLDKSKRAILDAGSAIICEGQLDLIACFMNGVQNIVAPQGTAFTDQHARIIKRYANEVVLCFDSDNAGQNAIVRSLDHLLAAELAVRVAVVPPPHDPDSFIKNFGAEKFRELVEHAAGFFEFLLDRLCATNDAATDKGRLAILRGMAEALHKTGNRVLIDTHAQKTALRLGVPPEAVRAEFKKNPSPQLPPVADEEESFESAESIEVSEPSRDEFKVLQLLFKTDEFVAWMSDYFDLNWIKNETVKKIISERIQQHRGNLWYGLPQFLESLNNENLQTLVTKAVSSSYVTDIKDYSRERALPKPFDDLQGFAMRMRKSHMEDELRKLESLRSTLEPGSAEQIEVIHRLKNLKAHLKQPLSPLQN